MSEAEARPPDDWPTTLDEFRRWHERRGDLGPGFLTNLVLGDRLRLDPPSIDLPLADLYDGIPLE